MRTGYFALSPESSDPREHFCLAFSCCPRGEERQGRPLGLGSRRCGVSPWDRDVILGWGCYPASGTGMLSRERAALSSWRAPGHPEPWGWRVLGQSLTQDHGFSWREFRDAWMCGAEVALRCDLLKFWEAFDAKQCIASCFKGSYKSRIS